MKATATTSEPAPERLFTWRSGGWVLALTALFSIFVVVVVLGRALQHQANRPPGDGKDPATYGFALEPRLVPEATFVAGALHRDIVPALVDPGVLAGASVDTYNREKRGKFLVSKDRVIGVAVGGSARAYPVAIMRLHEIANDTVGGVPIVVTYNPLCDSAVVFERTVDGVERTFGLSGLLSNSHLLMYDRTEAEPQSLWSQLEGRAVTGPAAAAGLEFRRVRMELTHWSDWLERYPETTVIKADPELTKRYQNNNYAGYYRDDELLVRPVEPLPPSGLLPLKAPCVIVRSGDAERVYPVREVSRRADASGRWSDELDGRTLRFRVFRDPGAMTVAADDGAPLDVIHAFWFAWYALHPDADVLTTPEPEVAG